jgi:hypothetical protein
MLFQSDTQEGVSSLTAGANSLQGLMYVNVTMVFGISSFQNSRNETRNGPILKAIPVVYKV